MFTRINGEAIFIYHDNSLKTLKFQFMKRALESERGDGKSGALIPLDILIERERESIS